MPERHRTGLVIYSCGHRDDTREKPPLLCPVCHTGSLVTRRLYERHTDSAGVTVEYRPLSSLEPGDEIAGGWKPWAVVARVERRGDEARVYFTTHGPGDWFPLSEKFPVVVEDAS